MPKKYRKKVETVEVLKTYLGQPMTEIRDFLIDRLYLSTRPYGCSFTDPIEGDFRVVPGDYIIKSDTGKISICSVAEFEEKYERVADPDEVFMIVSSYGFTVKQAEFMLNNDDIRDILLGNIAGSLEGILSEECIQKNVYSK